MKEKRFSDGRVGWFETVRDTGGPVSKLLAESLARLIELGPSGFAFHHAGITRDSPARAGRRYHLAVYFAPEQGEMDRDRN